MSNSSLNETTASAPGLPRPYRARYESPRVMICSWCPRADQQVIGVRPLDTTAAWYYGSIAFARALKAAGLASHGVCSACRAALAVEWGDAEASATL